MTSHEPRKRDDFPCLFIYCSRSNHRKSQFFYELYNINSIIHGAMVRVSGVDLCLIRVKCSQAARRQMRRRSPHPGPTQLDIKARREFLCSRTSTSRTRIYYAKITSLQKIQSHSVQLFGLKNLSG